MMSSERISKIVICIYLVVAFLSERSILGNIALVSVFIMFFVQVLVSRKIHWDRYFIYELLFLLYCLIQNIVGIPIYASAAKDRLVTLLICFFFEFAIFNLFKNAKEYGKLNKSMATAITIAIFWGIIINFRTLLSFSERVSNTPGISIGGITIGAVNSAGIAWYAGIGISILVVNVISYNYKLYQYLFCYFILVSSIILSGTRKALVFIPLGLLPLVFKKSDGKNILSKIIKYIIIIGLVSILGLFLILKIPSLYNLVGYRIESLFTYRSTGIIEESSLSTRVKLAELAVLAFKGRPITGWGLDNFKNMYYYGKYYSHNNYLEMAVNGGIIGIILYFSKYIYLIRKIIIRYRRSVGTRKIESIYMLLTMLAFAFLEIWQVTYFSRKSLLIYVFLLYMIEKNNTEDLATEIKSDKKQG